MSSTVRKPLLAFTLFLFAIFRVSALSDIYWETPVPLAEGNGRFPIASYRDGLAAVVWQETAVGEDGALRVRLSMASKRGDADWRIRRSFAGPYIYSGNEPSVASLAIDGKGRILIAIAASPSSTEILASGDDGASFSRAVLDGGSESSIAPRLYVRADGGYILFATRGQDQSLTIHASKSEDGVVWSPFAPFVDEAGLRLNFLPTHAAAAGSDFVVFQSLSSGVRPTFQLYLKRSDDGGATWSPARLVTSFDDPFSQTRTQAENFDNQRPHLSVLGDSLFLVWERRSGSASPQVYAAEIAGDGSLLGEVDRVSSAGSYCNNPIGFEFDGEASIVWFDNRRGQNRVYFAQRSGIVWQESDLSGARGDAAFARPVPTPAGLFVFWQSTARGTDRIYVAGPDRTVEAPILAAENFESGKAVRRDVARFSWKAPEDASGISSYSFSWSMDPGAEPPRNAMSTDATTSAERRAPEDGSWFFSILAKDFAGNWSRPARIEFVRDTTPPPKANIVPPPLDEGGFLASNTFSIEWNPPPASDIASYAWDLEYLAPLDYAALWGDAEFQTEAAARFPAKAPTPRALGSAVTASFSNRDDGIWRFSVAVIDEVGNIGEASSYYMKANKYVPYTYITFADALRDDQGTLTLKIVGRGFSVGGLVERIFLDRDGRAPYDREFLLERGEYRVVSDREISGLRVEDLEAGRYRIGLIHPTRGIHVTAPLVNVDESGTVKFGDFSQEWEPSWIVAQKSRFVFDSVVLVLAAVLVFGLIGLFVSVRGIGDVLREGMAVRDEVAALITGDLMPSEKKKRAASIRKRGISLRLKLATFTTILVVMVVVIVSLPLSLLMTRTQETTLLRGLKDRSKVLLESLASGARAYLPSRNVLELGFLPAQASAIPEARYATITGFGSDATIFSDHIWATNDPAIGSKIDTAAFQAGVSRLQDPLTPRLVGIAKELDDQARSEVGELSAGIAGFTQEALKLALRTDAASVRARDDIQTTTRELEARLNERLTAIASEIGSEPEFSLDQISPETRTYIFFKPVMYRQGSEDLFFRGLVRLEVSTDSIIAEIAAGRRELIRITSIVALIAVGIGVIGALFLSMIIIGPIKKLVGHVRMIRDTENKADLQGKDIVVKSKDEIAELGDTINDMTHGLVKAAAASKDLTVGKDVQKMFIPLETDERGRKLTTGSTITDEAEFFGYYEGAKGVSGDYFNYLKLDDRYFAVIKCDVSGKGVPAALIMVEVATLFLDHFKNWTNNAAGLNLEPLVYRINDFINSQGYKGLFAAFTLCLLDTKSGLVRFCNAGDTLVHYYDASEARMKILTLAQTPAAGPFPNELIEMKSGFPMQTLKLDSGDFLLLYTDGIEEGKRYFRNSSQEMISCKEPGIADGAAHDNHQKGDNNEEFGYPRVESILNAVLTGGRFELVKHHPADPSERLSFDFSRGDRSFKDGIMALVAIERIFRFFRDPKAGEDSKVLVDRKVDAFLKGCFEQYRTYCSRTRDHGELPEYMYYTNIREDDQYDDLTILGIKKK